MPGHEIKKLFKEFENVSKEQWLQLALKDLNKKNPEDLIWASEEGLEIEPFYNLDDLKKNQFGPEINSINSSTQQRKWKFLEYIGNDNVKEANKNALAGLSQGADGVIFQTMPRSKNVFLLLLNKIVPDICNISFKDRTVSSEKLKNYIKIIEGNRYEITSIEGGLFFDPIANWTLQKDSKFPDLNELKQVITLAAPLPNFSALTISSDIYKNSGANIVQEIALVITATIAYVEECSKLGIEPDTLFENIQYNASIGSNYFFEIVKISVIKILVTQIAKAYGVQDFTIDRVKIHAETSLWNKTTIEPYNNILRNTTEAMAGILGGCHSLSIFPYDYLEGKADEHSTRIARNISHILKEEAYLDKIKNPIDGSFYLESLREAMLKKSWEAVQDIESKGGYIKAFNSGYLTGLLKNQYNNKIKSLLEDKTKIIGVNYFANKNETDSARTSKVIDNLRGWFDNKTLASVIENK